MGSIGRRLLALGTAFATATAMAAAVQPPALGSTPAAKSSAQSSTTVLDNKTPVKGPKKEGTTTRAVRGAPVNPAPYTAIQPDGTKLTLVNHGDSLRSWTTTDKGATVVKDSSNTWRYADHLDANGQPAASAVAAGPSKAPPSASTDLKPSKDRVAAPVDDRAPFAGFTGNQRTVVILAQFLDLTSRGTTPAQWSQNFFGASGSVRSFYKGASFNQLDLVPATETSGTANDGVIGWVTLPMNHPNTGEDTSTVNQNLTAAAIQAADPFIDYAAFDTNGDGYIAPGELHITVIVAGYETSYGGTSSCSPSVWGHKWAVASAPTVDGKIVGRLGYTQFGEVHCLASNPAGAHMATIGIMAHEFGHDLGWTDLYDTSFRTEGIGAWSLMASGSWGTSGGGQQGNSPTLPDAYSKYLQGWITPTVVNTSGRSVSLSAAATSSQAVLLGVNPGGAEMGGTGEYFLVENRQPTGLDAALPGCGLLVYHVAETFTNNAGAVSTGRLIDVEEAGGPQDMDTYPGSRGSADDPWHAVAGHTQFNATSVPNSNFYSGAGSGASMVATGGCAATMTATVTGAGTLPVAPANDNFVNGRVLTPVTGGTWTQTTANATKEAGEPAHATWAGGASVWFNWTAPSTGKLTVTTAGSSFDTLLGIYTGGAVNALTTIASSDDVASGDYTSRVSNQQVIGGTTYRIAVDGYQGQTGVLNLGWSFTPDVVAPPKFVSLAPSRILDTRYGIGAPKMLVPAGGRVDLQVTGVGGVPAGASAVVLNVTAVSPVGPGSGYVTVWPTGAVRPTASNLNFVPGQTVPNLVVTKVGTGGKVSLYTAARTQLIADVAGYYPAGAAYSGVTPVRVLDTRYGIGAPKVRIPAGGTVTVTIGGANGVPANASAAVVNITTVGPAGAGSVTAYPAGVAVPSALSVSYRSNQTIAGMGVVKLGTGGKITLRSTASTELIVDLDGWVPAGGDTVAFTPTRLVTNRAVASGGSFTVQVAGVAGVPANAKAVQVTVTAANPSTAGYLTVYPTGGARPVVSNLNYTTGGSISNSAIVKVGTGGTITVFASGATPVTVDTSAYWTP